MLKLEFAIRGVAITAFAAAGLACADAPTQPKEPATSALLEPTSRIRVVGRDTIFSGDAAKRRIREAAVLYAKNGNRELADRIRTPMWRDALGPGDRLTTRAPDPQMVFEQSEFPGPGWGAQIFGSSTTSSASGSSGTVSSFVWFFGTHAYNNVSYSASKNGSYVVGPLSDNDAGMGDHVLQCLSMAANNQSCGWVGGHATAVGMSFGSHTCGVTLTSGASHQAWFGLGVSVGGNGIEISIGNFGHSAIRSDPNHSASNPVCSPPTAHFTMTAGSGGSANDGQTLTLNSIDGNGFYVSVSPTGSTGGGSAITSYEWTINGQSQGSGSGFGQGFGVGTHTIGLTITNAAGLTASTSGTIVITHHEECDELTTELIEDCEDDPDDPPNVVTQGGSVDEQQTDLLIVRCWYIDTWINGVYQGREWLGCEIIG